MSEEFGIDLDDVFKVIEQSEVLVVRFSTVGSKRLLIDFRTDEQNLPFIGLVEPANSVEERIRSVKKLRPSFPYPEKFMSFQWPRSIPLLEVSGVWEKVGSRMIRDGGEFVTETIANAYEELVFEERQQIVGAIRGTDEWQTIWQSE
ncbi:MAG: hypothetical protein ACJ0J7_03365 [Tepidiformaceae bacterium]